MLKLDDAREWVAYCSRGCPDGWRSAARRKRRAAVLATRECRRFGRTVRSSCRSGRRKRRRARRFGRLFPECHSSVLRTIITQKKKRNGSFWGDIPFFRRWIKSINQSIFIMTNPDQFHLLTWNYWTFRLIDWLTIVEVGLIGLLESYRKVCFYGGRG